MLPHGRLSERGRRVMLCADLISAGRKPGRGATVVSTFDLLLALCDPESPTHHIFATNGISYLSLRNHLAALEVTNPKAFDEPLPNDTRERRGYSAGVETVLDAAGKSDLYAVGPEHLLRALIACSKTWPVGLFLATLAPLSKLWADADRACMLIVGSFVPPAVPSKPTSSSEVTTRTGNLAIVAEQDFHNSGTALFPHHDLAEVEKAIRALRAASCRRPGGPHTAMQTQKVIEAAREFCRAADTLSAMTILPPDERSNA